MNYENIECCSTTIFRFIDLQELCKLKIKIGNKTIHKSIHYLIQEKMKSTLLYKTILTSYFPLKPLETTPIIFFSTLQSYLQRGERQFDFKMFLFHVFDRILDSHTYNQFYLATRNYRLYMVKKINYNEIILFIQPNYNSVYYTKMYRPSRIESSTLLNIDTELLCGYIYKDNTYEKEPEFIWSLFKPLIPIHPPLIPHPYGPNNILS